MSQQTFDRIIEGGTVFTPFGRRETDIGILGGKIVSLGALSAASAGERISARGLMVLPGLIDSQVHFREPGLEHKEDLATGTAGAALGGVTAIFEMPNTKPNTDTLERLEDKVRRGREKAFVDFAFFAGATDSNVEELRKMELAEGCAGVKIFMGSSTGSLLVDDAAALRAILRGGTRRVAVHCEDESRLNERRALVELDGPVHPREHPVWRDEQTAFLATQRLLGLAEEAGRRVHVLHVTTAEEMKLLARHKKLATVEVTPQHLTLAAPEAYDRLGTKAQMNPPIRGERHRAALWEALRAGVVDVIGSDHAPHTLEEKGRPYPKSPSGMPGVQTTVPLMLHAISEGKMTLEHLVELMAHGPQRVHQLSGKGRIALGYDADFTFIDLGREETIEDSKMATRCGWTPFHGMRIQGWPVRTIIRGHDVMVNGELMPRIEAQPVRFLEARNAMRAQA